MANPESQPTVPATAPTARKPIATGCDVWLLWEHAYYEPSTLHGIYGTEDAAQRAFSSHRKRLRRECVSYGVGPDEVYETRKDAYAAAEERLTEFKIAMERVE